MLLDPPLTIKLERLTLNTPTSSKADADAYVALFSNPANVKDEPTQTTAEQIPSLVADWIERIKAKRSLQLLVTHQQRTDLTVRPDPYHGNATSSSGFEVRTVGCAGFNYIYEDKATGKWIGDAGVLIDTPYLRRGFGREVVEGLLSWAFANEEQWIAESEQFLGHKLDVVFFACLERNSEFRAFMAALGFEGKQKALDVGTEFIFEIERAAWHEKLARQMKALGAQMPQKPVDGSTKTIAEAAAEAVASGVELHPIDLHDKQQFQELKQQRVDCGWAYSDSALGGWRDYMDNGLKGLFWITLPDGTRAGHVSLDRDSTHTPPDDTVATHDGRVLTIASLYTSAKGKGLGRMAMDLLEDMATKAPHGSEKCEYITVNCLNRRYLWDPNWRAIFERCGFPPPKEGQLVIEDWYARRGYIKYKERRMYPTSTLAGEKILLMASFLRKRINGATSSAPVPNGA